MVPFSFAHREFRLGTRIGDGRALYWPDEQALLVADLHLEKASFYARFGQMLPPYDSRETLERIARAIRGTGARRVFCLGDSFHDRFGAERLEPHAAGMLAALTRATDWVWITGNHDEDVADHPGGTRVEELAVSGIVLRHEAKAGEVAPELSGHFHPKLRLAVRGRNIARPCLVVGKSDGEAHGGRMILPAIGALTGGMDAADPAILAAMQPATEIEALVPAADRLARFPLWRQPAQTGA
ncbi:ligase-associated DNA damage response endonuclease PdeM [Novosphingobium sp. NBM11]|uniref:ligase-associated DNA damage response endonuclease PdeM n=1 Tax=Novosphingobium sp. NBM11 TaxID=2596914 RepID=UPI00189280ED|nr:ligase-associated DNA damage response endonuclease PdeM [Novosphingobium sp. NBM11]MBF5089329.1 ligase-associated DNA damage response endonuclease PdeM [Novosphingobium sp. NBM11]